MYPNFVNCSSVRHPKIKQDLFSVRMIAKGRSDWGGSERKKTKYSYHNDFLCNARESRCNLAVLAVKESEQIDAECAHIGVFVFLFTLGVASENCAQ